MKNIIKNYEELTYQQLKAVVASTEGLKTPGYKALQDFGEVLFETEASGGTLTVFTNGFYLFLRGEEHTVYGVDRCRKLRYEFDNGEWMEVDESEYADSPCLMVLLLAAEHRLEHNGENRDDYNDGFHLSNDGNDWAEEASVPGIEDELMLLEQMKEEADELARLRKAMDKLTEKQRAVVDMYYFKGMTQVQIAEKMGVSDRTIRYHLEGAIKKIKKILGKVLPVTPQNSGLGERRENRSPLQVAI